MDIYQAKRSDLVVLVVAISLVLAIIGAVIFSQLNSSFKAFDTRINNIEEKNMLALQELTPNVTKQVLTFLEEKEAKELQAVIEARLEPYSAATNGVPDGRKIYGSLSARFTIVEYSDIECSFCKRFHYTPKEIVDGSNGNVSWEWKHMPLGFHNPAAIKLAHASECVAEQQGNKGFWSYIDYLFANTSGNGKGIPDTALRRDLKEFGVDSTKFQSCMTDNRYMSDIQNDMQDARKLKVTSTPTSFIVDNHTGQNIRLKGLKKPEQIIQVITMMLNQGNEQNG